MTSVFAGYPGTGRDEAVGPDGAVRPAYRPVAQVLEALGGAGIATVVGAVDRERRRRGVVVGDHVDGRLRERPLPLCPVPRVLGAEDWAHLAAGAEQRTRALNAFLADVYRPAGRRRGDPDRHAEVVRAGVVPAALISASPGHRPAAVGLAGPGQQRATVAGLGVLRGPDGWLAVSDDLCAPAGLGHALSNRDSSRAALPGLHAAAEDDGLVDPATAVPLLRAALADAAPRECTGEPRIALLSGGPGEPSWFEQGLLAEALGVPLVTPGQLWPAADGGVTAQLDGERQRVHVLYRRLDEAELAAHLTATGTPLDVLVAEAVRAGRLTVANVPGNGVADDPALYRCVPEMIRFYLGEEPVLATVPTWVLADDADLAQVRDRLHELVLRPVDGYGGRGLVSGPLCSAAELAELQAEVLAAPHRFVAAEPVDCSTVPAVVDGVLVPRRVDLRLFTVAGRQTRALPAPLTRVAPADGAQLVGSGPGSATKDTWLLS
ncbi:circularly permuted type 2 ATP-grasp protein [uncultured Modestobacter sp.]|uniref:circularly permuted type 2 ATP-grasp protein n=1 Tax=uncultured Modestobacter sp. TaxID=380048 RepID=UPI00261CB3F8|nr:circularly permuted type 2 ATP-grasp protein [uncultured Modestobacter sp.]